MKAPKLIPIIGLLLSMTGCGSPSGPPAGKVSVDRLTVRLNANPAAPAAAYFTLHGGAKSTTLVEISSADAARVEMHESRMEGGVMRMDKLAEIPVAAGSEVVFAPGGKHAMLWDIGQQAKAAGKLRLTFRFSDGEQLQADAPIEKTGGDMDMSGNMAMPGDATMNGHQGH